MAVWAGTAAGAEGVRARLISVPDRERRMTWGEEALVGERWLLLLADSSTILEARLSSLLHECHVVSPLAGVSGSRLRAQSCMTYSLRELERSARHASWGSLWMGVGGRLVSTERRQGCGEASRIYCLLAPNNPPWGQE